MTLSRLLREDLPEEVIDGLINVVRCEITGQPYDIGFFSEYRRNKNKQNRKLGAKYRFTEEQLMRKIQRDLDEAQLRRELGGWNLSL